MTWQYDRQYYPKQRKWKSWLYRKAALTYLLDLRSRLRVGVIGEIIQKVVRISLETLSELRILALDLKLRTNNNKSHMVPKAPKPSMLKLTLE